MDNFLETCGLRPCYNNKLFMDEFKKNIKYIDFNIEKFKKRDILKKKEKKNISYISKCRFIIDYVNHYYNVRDFSNNIEDYTSDEDEENIEDDMFYETYFSD